MSTIVVPASDLFKAGMAAAQVGVFVLHDGRCCYVNPFLETLLGYGAGELRRDADEADLLATALPVPARYELLAAEPGTESEVVLQTRNGDALPAVLLAVPARCGELAVTVVTVLDARSRNLAEQRIRELIDFDTLTGLPNRRLLKDRMQQALAAAARDEGSAVLMFVDLDHFKRVNDSLGHSVGDELLCAVAQRYQGAMRQVDTLARLGGDEFILVLPGMTAMAGLELARRLLSMAAQPVFVAGHALTVTASIGISVYPQNGSDMESLLKNADTAMYRAKELGRNAFQYYASEMNKATLERLLMESNLRRALLERQFTLHYQPLVELASGRIIGVEALIRWQHPELGIIMPDSFIPVAEDTGLINPIGDWVLCAACRQAQRWIDAGLGPLRMAVNVSPVQFRQAGFIHLVAGVLATSGLAAPWLELELTERTLMHDAEVTLGSLSALSRMGVHLSLDDFGTGYSSLAYLKRFPVDKLKIDRSFVHDLAHAADDLAIASTIVSMGSSLRLTVLAEGIETREQLALLRHMACEQGQGYYFSRPLTADKMTEMLKQQPFLTGET